MKCSAMKFLSPNWSSTDFESIWTDNLFCFTKELLNKQRRLHTKQRIRLLFTSNKNTGKQWQKRPWFHCFILFLSPGKHVHQNKSFAVCAKAGSWSRGILLAFAIRFLQSIMRPVSAPLPSRRNTFTDLVALTQAGKSTNGFPIIQVPFINSFFTGNFPTAKNIWILKCVWQRRRWVSMKCFEKPPQREWTEFLVLRALEGHSIMRKVHSNVTPYANTVTYSNVTLDRPL